jgi:hypothetical protein
LQYFNTESPSSPNAKTVEYIATFTDEADPSRGVITNAVAKFLPEFGAAIDPVAVRPIAEGGTTIGEARTPYQLLTLTSGEYNAGGKSFDLNIEANGNYYAGSHEGPVVITIAVPGKDYVNGGGHTVATNSFGTYAATLNSKVNFGFTMKWNKSGKNPQGQANIIIRRMVNGIWRTYQIKSNSINSLATVNTADGRRADFNTKANFTDITNPLAPVTITGNLDLSVQAFESTKTGIKDQIGITLRSSTGELMFSNNWIAGKTEMQVLGGGAVRVLSSTTAPIAPATARTSAEEEVAAASDKSLESLESVKASAYPNPFYDKFTLSFGKEVTEEVVIQVVDMKGAVVFTKKIAANSYASEVEIDMAAYRPGTYLVQTIIGTNRQVTKMIKQ